MPSSSSTIAKQAQAQERSPQAPAPYQLQPVPTNPSPASQTLRHVHSALLLALFSYNFGSLVADPVASMAGALPVVVAVQAAYALVCVPVAGSQAKAVKKPRPGEKKTGLEGNGGSNVFVVGVLPNLALTVCDGCSIHAHA